MEVHFYKLTRTQVSIRASFELSPGGPTQFEKTHRIPSRPNGHFPPIQKRTVAVGELDTTFLPHFSNPPIRFKFSENPKSPFFRSKEGRKLSFSLFPFLSLSPFSFFRLILLIELDFVRIHKITKVISCFRSQFNCNLMQGFFYQRRNLGFSSGNAD